MKVSVIVASPKAAHEMVSRLYQETIKPETHLGRRMRITVESVNPYYRHQLRKLFHGPMLRDISLQVVLTDATSGEVVRYSKAAWKEHLRDLFIPPVPRDVVDRETGEAVGIEMVKRSTEDLCDDDFAEFVLQVAAYATLDLGVVFVEQEDEEGE